MKNNRFNCYRKQRGIGKSIKKEERKDRKQLSFSIAVAKIVATAKSEKNRT